VDHRRHHSEAFPCSWGAKCQFYNPCGVDHRRHRSEAFPCSWGAKCKSNNPCTADHRRHRSEAFLNKGGATRKRLCPQWLLVNPPAFEGQSVSLIIPVEWITEDTVQSPSSTMRRNPEETLSPMTSGKSPCSWGAKCWFNNPCGVDHRRHRSEAFLKKEGAYTQWFH